MNAVGIKRLLYADPSKVTGDLTPAMLKSILEDAETEEVTNVHQDTWSMDESEASVTRYNNQLTKKPYRQSAELGEVTMNFTIGEYDFKTKKNLMGGVVITKTGGEAIGWKRSRTYVEIHKCLMALTEDDVWAVFPKGAVVTREAETDGATGLAVVGTAMEPENADISTEYWFYDKEVQSSSGI